MTTLIVTPLGQVTFQKDVLEHLGVRPGGTIELDLLPNGRAEMKAVRSDRSFDQFHGFLDGKTNGTRLTIDELNEAIAEAGAASGAQVD